jgi:arabinogalactan endo-1,4-beta-galactosidase
MLQLNIHSQKKGSPLVGRLLLLWAVFVLSSCGSSPTPTPPKTPPFYRGVDISALPEIEQYPVSFSSNGQTLPLLKILKNNGVNLIRLRLWHTPATAHSALPEVLALAKRIQQENIAILLDIHYADTWADPGTQMPPAIWQGLSAVILADSVYQYTRKVLTAFKVQNTLPAMVQIGNEINSGLLWNESKVGGAFNHQWTTLANMLKSGIRAVQEVAPEAQTMIHLAGTESAQWFFDNLKAYQVNYDIMGISYYPWWHGKDLNALQTTLTNLTNRYDKPVIVAETAYPWTLGWNDWTNNIIGQESQTIAGYPATPAGQKQFLTDLKQKIKAIPNEKGIGFCYWAAEWIAFKGTEGTNASPWENLALFDFESKALPAWVVFGE